MRLKAPPANYSSFICPQSLEESWGTVSDGYIMFTASLIMFTIAIVIRIAHFVSWIQFVGAETI